MERASVYSIFLFTLFSFIFFFIFNNFLQGTFIERITVVNAIASNTFTKMSYRLDIVIFSLSVHWISPWFDSLVSSQRCFDLWFLSKQYPFSIFEFSPIDWNLFMFILRWIWYLKKSHSQFPAVLLKIHMERQNGTVIFDARKQLQQKYNLQHQSA